METKPKIHKQKLFTRKPEKIPVWENLSPIRLPACQLTISCCPTQHWQIPPQSGHFSQQILSLRKAVYK